MGFRMRRSLMLVVGLISICAASGCAQRKMAVVPDSTGVAQAAGSQIKSVQVLDAGRKLSVTLDRPATYTSYKINEPMKAVIDFAQTDIGTVTAAADIREGALARYEISRQSTAGGQMARLEVFLAKDADFTVAADPGDPTHVIVTFTVNPAMAENQPRIAEPAAMAPVAAAPPAEASAPAAAAPGEDVPADRDGPK